MHHDEVKNSITYSLSDFDSDSDDRYDLSNSTIDLDGSTRNAGDLSFEVEAQDEFDKIRGINVSVHVILNFVGTLLTRQHHQLKSSGIHKYFLQRLVATSIGKQFSLLYPEAMIFPFIFLLTKDKS